MPILVTGGAGYIGSHMVSTLLQAGHNVTVVDDLSTGLAILPEIDFIPADIGNRPLIAEILKAKRIDTVMHFAGRICVGESVADPRLYYQTNLSASIALFDAMLDADVNKIIFSSSAAVYGNLAQTFLPQVRESHSTVPVNPYGETKLAVERMLVSYSKAYGLNAVSLRYFNAAGAAFGLKERHNPETHLIPLILRAAREGTQLAVFGSDHDTFDGTCIRDYVHVLDLCDAHVAAMNYLTDGGGNAAINVGTGRGHTVMEVIETARRVTGREVRIATKPRRKGDPPRLVANVERAAELLNWRAKRPSLEEIIRDAWAAEGC